MLDEKSGSDQVNIYFIPHPKEDAVAPKNLATWARQANYLTLTRDKEEEEITDTEVVATQ